MSTAVFQLAPRVSDLCWERFASCLGLDLTIFYGSDVQPLNASTAKTGRRICAGCPVRRDCLLDALVTGERAGLRAGFLGHERRAAMRHHGGDIAAAMRDYDEGVFYQLRRRHAQ